MLKYEMREAIKILDRSRLHVKLLYGSTTNEPLDSPIQNDKAETHSCVHMPCFGTGGSRRYGLVPWADTEIVVTLLHSLDVGPFPS